MTQDRHNIKAILRTVIATLLLLCCAVLLRGPLVLSAGGYLKALPWQRALLEYPRWHSDGLFDNISFPPHFFSAFPPGRRRLWP